MTKNNANLLYKLWFIILPIVSIIAYYFLSRTLNMLTFELFLGILKIPMQQFIEFMYLSDILIALIQLIIFFVIYKLVVRRDEDELKTKFNSKDTGLSLVAGIGVSGISFIWLIIAGKLPMFQAQLAAMKEGNGMIGGGSLHGVFLSAVIAAPIVEEVIFRGVVLGSFRKVFPAWISILVSAIIFGAYHMNPVAIVYASLMGIVAGIVYEKKRNLLFTIMLHMANNFMGLLEDFVPKGIGVTIVNGVSLVMILPMCYVVYKMIKSDTRKTVYA
ncbi:MAG: lysostaphin resistance A-like protein [Catonella sp.]|uniref:CPBP family intramembrane glutamic endopeptidase n=1 Tax=Catonella sp. TaxID=2382125 RepID=UPI003FA04753